MIPQIAKALSKGFTTSQVIKYILRQFPNHKDAIEKALAAGFTADQVIRFLSRNSGKELQQPTNPRVNTEYAEMKDIDQARRQREEKIAMGTMGAVAGAPIALNALRGIGQQGASMAMQHAMPSNPATLLGNTPQKLLPTLPQQQPPQSPMGGIPPSQSMPSPANIPQPPVTSQAIVPQRDIKKSVDLIKNIGEEGRIKNLIEGGLEPKDIAGVLRKLVGKDKLQALESLEGGLEAAIEDYAQGLQSGQKDLTEAIPSTEQMTPEIIPEPEVAQEDLNLPEETIEEPKPIEKNSIVSSPHGVGEVKAIRNGKAIIEVDGRQHQVNEDELEKSEYSDDQIRETYDKLMGMLPESERSGFISWAGYDEDTGVLQYIPHGGHLERLTNITPEEAELIKHGKGVARTTGKNIQGMWVLGGDTRGLISQIRHDREKKHKEKENQQLKLFEMPKAEKQERKGTKTIYHEMAYPYKLSQEHQKKLAQEARDKKKAEKEEEKARLKREKDEAKKRKRQT